MTTLNILLVDNKDNNNVTKSVTVDYIDVVANCPEMWGLYFDCEV